MSFDDISVDDSAAFDVSPTKPRPGSGRPLRPIRVCIVDMNNGHVNQAMRCLRGIVAQFFERVRRHNPDVPCELGEVSPRNTTDPVPDNYDLYLSSGGPGSPYDGDGMQWVTDYGRFVDGVMESSVTGGGAQRSLFAICYSFEMVVRHLNIAAVVPRVDRKFGVMPVYMTPEGQEHPLLKPFGDRLFAFEHRNWEAVDLDTRKLATLGGKLLALESRDGVSKGRAILGLDMGPGLESVQFHPEADRPGVMNWISRPEQAAAFKATYGEVTYQAMLRTLDDPKRLARTYALVIPGWLARKFNEIAIFRDYIELPPPSEDVSAAFAAVSERSEATPPREPSRTEPAVRPAAPAAQAGATDT
jgi:homoserine O-succinyltransferase/O-acetyltransferase